MSQLIIIKTYTLFKVGSLAILTLFLFSCSEVKPITSEDMISLLLEIGQKHSLTNKEYVERSLGIKFISRAKDTNIQEASKDLEFGEATYLIDKVRNAANLQFFRKHDKPCISPNLLTLRLAAQFQPWPYHDPQTTEWLIVKTDKTHSVLSYYSISGSPCVSMIQLYQFQKG